MLQALVFLDLFHSREFHLLLLQIFDLLFLGEEIVVENALSQTSLFSSHFLLFHDLVLQHFLELRPGFSVIHFNLSHDFA